MPRDNNFDLIRLTLAWIVVLGHCYELSLAQPLGILSPLMQSTRAVEGFFAISGCLIVASWERSTSVAEYLKRRARRILPAYWVAILFSLALGSLFTKLPILAFWRSAGTWHYIFFNLLFLNFIHPGLPGVFEGNPVTSALNGALWTIKIEVAFYLLVPLLVLLFRRTGLVWGLGATFVTSVCYRIGLEHLGRDVLAKQLPGQLPFFMIGAAVYYFFPQFVANRGKVWLVSLVLFPIALISGWFVVDAVATPLLVLCLAFLLPAHRGITRYGDFSYGTYVLHFPIVQTVIALGIFDRSPWLALGLVSVLVSLLACASWFAVERRFLHPRKTVRAEAVVRVA